MNRNLMIAILLAVPLMLTATNADAKRHHHRHHTPQSGSFVASDAWDANANPAYSAPRAQRAAGGYRAYASLEPVSYPQSKRTHQRASNELGENVLHGRPSGCPHRYCGCEASIYLFGSIRKELNLASNWYRKFPAASPAPGMAAARSGHVMVLVRHISGSEWLVHDGNSGYGMTREHVRSIRGYRIVNPHGSRMASHDTSAL